MNMNTDCFKTLTSDEPVQGNLICNGEQAPGFACTTEGCDRQFRSIHARNQHIRLTHSRIRNIDSNNAVTFTVVDFVPWDSWGTGRQKRSRITPESSRKQPLLSGKHGTSGGKTKTKRRVQSSPDQIGHLDSASVNALLSRTPSLNPFNAPLASIKSWPLDSYWDVDCNNQKERQENSDININVKRTDVYGRDYGYINDNDNHVMQLSTHKAHSLSSPPGSMSQIYSNEVHEGHSTVSPRLATTYSTSPSANSSSRAGYFDCDTMETPVGTPVPSNDNEYITYLQQDEKKKQDFPLTLSPRDFIVRPHLTCDVPLCYSLPRNAGQDSSMVNYNTNSKVDGERSWNSASQVISGPQPDQHSYGMQSEWRQCADNTPQGCEHAWNGQDRLVDNKLNVSNQTPPQQAGREHWSMSPSQKLANSLWYNELEVSDANRSSNHRREDINKTACKCTSSRSWDEHRLMEYDTVHHSKANISTQQVESQQESILAPGCQNSGILHYNILNQKSVSNINDNQSYLPSSHYQQTETRASHAYSSDCTHKDDAFTIGTSGNTSYHLSSILKSGDVYNGEVKATDSRSSTIYNSPTSEMENKYNIYARNHHVQESASANHNYTCSTQDTPRSHCTNESPNHKGDTIVQAVDRSRHDLELSTFYSFVSESYQYEQCKSITNYRESKMESNWRKSADIDSYNYC